MNVNEQYTKELKKQFDYSATWFPSTILQPGDVGTLKDFKFRHVSSLHNLGINCKITRKSSTMEFDYCSGNSVCITSKASGQAKIPGSSLSLSDTGVNIKFSRDKAIVFRLAKCTSTFIDDLIPILEKLKSMVKTGAWTNDMALVTEVLKAKAATIIISNSSNAQIDLVAKGNANLSSINLADLDSGFHVLKKSNIATDFVCSRGLTPLFRTCGMKKSVTGSIHLTLGKQPSLIFGPVDYSDFES
jgi:hypothetical protein